MDDVIRYSGLKGLSEEEQSVMKSIIEKEFPKVKRHINKKIDLMVYVKVMKKESRKRYNINLRVNAPTKVIISENNRETEKGGDWDLVKAARKSMKALENEVKHRFKVEDRKMWKIGSIKRFFSED